MDTVALLGRAELFRFFDRASLEDLAAHTLAVRFERNEIVFTEGATADRRSPSGRSTAASRSSR